MTRGLDAQPDAAEFLSRHGVDHPETVSHLVIPVRPNSAITQHQSGRAYLAVNNPWIRSQSASRAGQLDSTGSFGASPTPWGPRS
jgi:hypothetical protein